MATRAKVQPTDEEILSRTPKGWLQPYLLQLDAMFTRRWDYWLRTLDAGKVLDEPIPRIDWLGIANPETMKNLNDCVRACHNRFPRDAFNLFVEWLLWGFGWPKVQVFPSRIEPALNASWYKTFNLGLFLKYPYDYPGAYIAEYYGSGRNNPTGYFPTPMNVCVMMAEMTFSDNQKGVTASVCDPCVGSGRLLMAASNYSLNLYGCDIDAGILNVCYVNMLMYVPWALGRREEIREFREGLAPKNGRLVCPVQQTTPEVQKRRMQQEGHQLTLFEDLVR